MGTSKKQNNYNCKLSKSSKQREASGADRKKPIQSLVKLRGKLRPFWSVNRKKNVTKRVVAMAHEVNVGIKQGQFMETLY